MPGRLSSQSYGNIGFQPLPTARKEGPLDETLLNRRTTCGVDTARYLPLDALSLILQYVFGYHGEFEPFEGVQALKKSSASGGSLHPIEAYLLTRDVDGLEIGLYHYSVERHGLERLESLISVEAGVQEPSLYDPVFRVREWRTSEIMQ